MTTAAKNARAEELNAMTLEHGPAGEAEVVNGEWVRYCKCGRKFVSRQGWRHVPALYDHLSTARPERVPAGWKP